MLINRFTRITGDKVILVPYQKRHVAKYHKWMESAELRLLTASERLTLEQEYEMQNSWMIDENKLTFIVLDKRKYQLSNDDVDAMIGDTNLFFVQSEDGTLSAESEIMIAEEHARGRKFGKEAMMLIMHYAIEKLSVKVFFAKIKLENIPSIRLFESLTFVAKEKSAVFNEVTFELIVDDVVIARFKDGLKGATIEDNHEFSMKL